MNTENSTYGLNMRDFSTIVISFSKMQLIDKANFLLLTSERLDRYEKTNYQ